MDLAKQYAGHAVLLGLALALGGGGCGKRTEAPKANPDLLAPPAKQPENEVTGVGPSKPEEKRPPHQPATPSKPEAERPVLAGFSDFAFGEKYAELKKSPKLRKRCKGRLADIASKKEFPSQSFEPRTLLCDALIADRYADMWLSFDHQDELCEVSFRFTSSMAAAFDGSRVRELTADEIDKFVADIRAVLEPPLGQPSDESSEGIGGRTIRLRWQGRTEDAPAHETEVVATLGAGFASVQYVRWADLTRKVAMTAQIEKERTASIRQKGL